MLDKLRRNRLILQRTFHQFHSPKYVRLDHQTSPLSFAEPLHVSSPQTRPIRAVKTAVLAVPTGLHSSTLLPASPSSQITPRLRPSRRPSLRARARQARSPMTTSTISARTSSFEPSMMRSVLILNSFLGDPATTERTPANMLGGYGASIIVSRCAPSTRYHAPLSCG